jgi:hypothetical protein
MLRHASGTPQHPWKFFRSGGLLQVSIETAEDLLALPSLDQKLWVALSCPVKGLDLDERTLALIDKDRDGHIHAREVLRAIEWAAARLKRPADLLQGEAKLALDDMNDASADDQILIGAAHDILRRLGKPEATVLTPEDFVDPAKVRPRTSLNGDGVIAPAETDDAEVQALIRDVITAIGGEKGCDGVEGVTREKVEAFFAQLTAYLGRIAENADKDIAVLGERTAAACTAIALVRPKVEEFYARCRLAAFDARALAALDKEEVDYFAAAAKDLVVTNEEIAGLPLARVNAEGILPVIIGLNPAWAAPMADFFRDTVTPVFGPDKRTLTNDEWRALNAKLSPYETWLGQKVDMAVERLGVDRAKALVASPARAKLDKLFARDKELQPQQEAVAAVEQLVRYHRDLATLLRNFINFADFYSRDRWAVFQAGKLYLDSRACELCIRVYDVPAHATLAVMSKAYVAYLDCYRGEETIKIAACITQGDSDYLFVGRNGLFYDRQGRDWHATITKIIENPVSLREAFWTPYKKVIRAIEEQVAKRAAAADTAAVGGLTTAAAPLAAGTPPPPKPPPPPLAPGTQGRKLDLSSIIGLSVALGSIGTFVATIFAKFVDLKAYQVPLVIIALMLAISLPSVVISWLKLRQRNLGPMLEANGWAINGRVKINPHFGVALTERAHVPPHATIRGGDPYASSHPIRNRMIFYSVLLVISGALLLLARSQDTWPFAPVAEVKQSFERVLQAPVSIRPSTTPTPASTPAVPPAQK